MIPGLPTQIPQGLNKDQEEAYLRKFNFYIIFSDSFFRSSQETIVPDAIIQIPAK